MSELPRHRILREVFRNYTVFESLCTQSGNWEIEHKGIRINFLDLQGSLKRLSKRKGEAVFYNVILDMKQKDVAEIMGITTVSVGQYVESSMIQLVKELWGDEENENKQNGEKGWVIVISGWKRRPSYDKNNLIEFDENAKYTDKELEQLADQLLRAHARSIDPETGKERGIKGENPILFEEHIYQRRRREILNENGIPEPNLVQGIYNRVHPEGRKVNSEEQRRRHGASWYRG